MIVASTNFNVSSRNYPLFSYLLRLVVPFPDKSYQCHFILSSIISARVLLTTHVYLDV